MKKMISLVLTAMTLFSLTACSGVIKKEVLKVECPNCGFEFEYVDSRSADSNDPWSNN